MGVVTWNGPVQQSSASLIRRSYGSATNVAFLMKLVLGWRLALVCSSNGIVLLLEAIGLGEGCLWLSLDRSGEDSSLLPIMIGERELIERGREWFTTLGGNCKLRCFGRRAHGVCFSGRSLGVANAGWHGWGCQRWWMQVEPEGIEDGGIWGSYHSFCFSVEDKGMTGGGLIAHANRNGRGGGWWKNNSIGIGLIHHGDWRCLCTSAVGFVLGIYHWSGREATKSFWQNYNLAYLCWSLYWKQETFIVH